MNIHARDRLLHALNGIPHGVLAMSREVPGLVETSNNLAVINTEETRAVLTTSHRSSVMPSLFAVQSQVRSICVLAGASVEVHDAYPGWKPNPDSPIVKTMVEVYKELFGKDPELKAIHAGLECGLLLEKVPDMDIVSIGPEIRNPHSPDERVQISSVQRFYEAVKGVLAKKVLSAASPMDVVDPRPHGDGFLLRAGLEGAQLGHGHPVAGPEDPGHAQQVLGAPRPEVVHPEIHRGHPVVPADPGPHGGAAAGIEQSRDHPSVQGRELGIADQFGAEGNSQHGLPLLEGLEVHTEKAHEGDGLEEAGERRVPWIVHHGAPSIDGVVAAGRSRHLPGTVARSPSF